MGKYIILLAFFAVIVHLLPMSNAYMCRYSLTSHNHANTFSIGNSIRYQCGFATNMMNSRDDADDDSDADGTISTLKGSDRRALRAISIRLKTTDSLVMLQTKSNYNDNFIDNLDNVLKSRELVQIKLIDCKKKKDAKAVGIVIASSTQSELVQVVGHSILLYKPSNDDNGAITQLLKKEIEKISS